MDLARERLLALTVGLACACSIYDNALLTQPQLGGASGSGSTIAGRPSAVGGSATNGGQAPAGGGGQAGSGPVGGGGEQEQVGGHAAEAGQVSDAGEGAVGGHAGTPAVPQGEGTITHELWTELPGTDLDSVPLDTPPDAVTLIPSFRSPTEGFEYAVRIRGFVTAPADGSYRFWIACDDNCVLALSSDETESNLADIAYLLGVDRWTDPDEWGKFASQESRLIELEAGRRYRIQAVVKQGGGGGNLSVGWLRPGESGIEPSEVIPGSVLSPIE